MKISIEIGIIEDEKEVIQSLYEWYVSHNCAMGELVIKDSEGNRVNLENCSHVWADRIRKQIK